MSLPLISRVAFHHLHPGTPLDTSNPHWETHFSQRVKRRHAMKTGRPYSKATYPTDDEPFHDLRSGGKMNYCEGKLAWCSATGVSVLCLKTGKKTSFTTENREYIIEGVRISESIVAAVSSRRYVYTVRNEYCYFSANHCPFSVCHVWNLRDGQTRHLHLPSLNLRHFVVSGNKVIMHFYTGSLLVWDYETQVAMETLLSERPRAFFFNRAGDSLSIIHFKELGHDTPSSVSLFRYSITGTNIYQSAPPTLILRDYPFTYFYDTDRTISTPCMNVFLSLNDGPDPPLPFPMKKALIDFSSGHSEPSLHTPLEVNKNSVAFSLTYSFFPHFCITMPGGILYQQIIPATPRSDVYVPPEIVVDMYEYSEIASIEKELCTGKESKNWAALPELGDDASYGLSKQFFGDGEFLCIVYEKCVFVYCFDENVFTPREDPGYREIRNQRAEQRAQLRRERAQS